MSSSAHAAVPTGHEALAEGDASFSQRFGDWGKDELDVQKESNKALKDIRNLIAGDKPGAGIWAGGAGAGAAAAAGASSGAGTPGTPSRAASGAEGRVPETTSDPAYSGGAAAAGEGTEGGRSFMFSQRKRFKDELDRDPQLKLRAAAILSLENEGAKTGVMESLWNRLNIPGHERSAAAGMGGGAKSFTGLCAAGWSEPRCSGCSATPSTLKNYTA